MANTFPLKPGEKPCLIEKYLASPKHNESAAIVLRIIEHYPDMEVKEIQIPKGNAYTCWYLYFRDDPKKRIINFTLYPNGNLNVEFRYVQYVLPADRESLQWQTENWPYARISKSGFTIQQVLDILTEYIPKCRTALEKGLLKRGGTSAAESVLSDILNALRIAAVEGERPEWLRNKTGNLLQLDFQLPSLKIAIEVQGPQHFQDLYGKPAQLDKRKTNDLFKVKRCLAEGKSLVWMSAKGIQKELARMTFADQKSHIRSLLRMVRVKHPCHALWESPMIPLRIKIKS